MYFFINRATISHKYNQLHRKIKYGNMYNRYADVIEVLHYHQVILVAYQSAWAQKTTANKEIKPKALKGQKEIKTPQW